MDNAVELYFVNTLEEGDTLGLRCYKGIALSSEANAHDLAHEVLHDCNDDIPGVEDIYPVRNDSPDDIDPVTGAVREDWLPMDWGGGYYPPGLRQADFNSGRLLMYGIGEPATSVAINIPRGSVYGVGFGAPAQTNLVLGPVSVGRDSMEAGEPVH